eukprot:scaffold31424_cov76-Skeletonema_marinoi.AAC.2
MAVITAAAEAFVSLSLQRRVQFSIKECLYLKFDLEMLGGLSSLKELVCEGNQHMTGNLRSLRALKDSLELEKSLYLPATARGGVGHKFQSISEVPSFIQAVHILLQRTPTPFGKGWLQRAFYWKLSTNSPDWYGWDNGSDNPSPPFFLQFIQAGPRLGWSWCDFDVHSCEINWLDAEPSCESNDYATYFEDLQLLERRRDFNFYSGFYVPPTEDQYRRLCEG